MPRTQLLRLVGPGLLVAATGVGAGDLATGAFAGSRLGLAVLWAVLVGAGFKWVLTEGLARYQLATGETLLEGALLRAPRVVGALFLAYLLLWSWFVGSALVSACGVAAHAIAPGVFEDAARGKAWWGALHSVCGLALVWRGGYRLLERALALSVGVMAVTVVVTAALLRPDPGELARGLLVPSVPADGDARAWTLGLVGGVGGTLTVLAYGYWIREEGREGAGQLSTCRLDLATGYAFTALFGVAMVVIGATVEVEGGGAGLVVALADRLEEPLGRGGRALFLAGAWAAVFSSLLGVWQSVPYLFADTARLLFRSKGAGIESARARAVDTRAPAYRGYLVALALVPLAGLDLPFRQVQLAYAVVGACFLPLLALALLVLNGRRALVGRLRNGPVTVVALLLTLAFFAWFGWLEVRR